MRHPHALYLWKLFESLILNGTNHRMENSCLFEQMLPLKGAMALLRHLVKLLAGLANSVEQAM
jgi:hypothetical protein